jgi:hypothetical protein
MTRIFSELTSDAAAHLERQRSWVRDHFIEEARSKYDDIDEKLRLISAILREKWVEPTETWKLQSLGVALGDALAQRLDMNWMIVEDEYGRDPTLKDPILPLNINPLTMISKRVERGETPDIFEMFKDGCNMVDELRKRLAS